MFDECVPHMAGDCDLEQKASGKPPAEWCQWEVSVPSGVSAEQQMCQSAGVCSGPCCTQSSVFMVSSKQGCKQSSVLIKSKCLCGT